MMRYNVAGGVGVSRCVTFPVCGLTASRGTGVRRRAVEALVVLLQLPLRVPRACAPGSRAFSADCSQVTAVDVISCL